MSLILPVNQVDAGTATNGYTLALDNSHQPYDCFNLTAIHSDNEVINEFYELVETRLRGVFGIEPMDGDDDNLLLVWRCSTAAQWKVDDMKKCIKLAWELITMFE